MAEVGAARAGGQDQVVVAIAPVIEDHFIGVRVKIHHFPKQDLDVGGLAYQQSQGRGHIRLGHQACSHLIEQGLEQVEIAFIDQGDPHGLAGEGLDSLEPRKASAYHNHMGTGSQLLVRGVQLQEEPFHCHCDCCRAPSRYRFLPSFQAAEAKTRA